jgi:hypothetical protein
MTGGDEGMMANKSLQNHDEHDKIRKRSNPNLPRPSPLEDKNHSRVLLL